VGQIGANDPPPNRIYGFHSVAYRNVVSLSSRVVANLDNPTESLSAHAGSLTLFAATFNPDNASQEALFSMAGSVTSLPLSAIGCALRQAVGCVRAEDLWAGAFASRPTPPGWVREH
jgi:hypothetical protein